MRLARLRSWNAASLSKMLQGLPICTLTIGLGFLPVLRDPDSFAHSYFPILSIGDHNPLHKSWNINDPFSPTKDILKDHPLVQMEDKENTKVLVHGILVGSIFSSIFGTLIPGAVYVQQSLEFRRPVYANEMVVGRISVEDIHTVRRRKGITLICKTQVLRNGKECIHGSAQVWLLNSSI